MHALTNTLVKSISGTYMPWLMTYPILKDTKQPALGSEVDLCALYGQSPTDVK